MSAIHQVAMVASGAFVFSQTISADTNDYNVKNAAIAAGWNQANPLDARISIAAGVVVGSTSTSGYAFDTGSGLPSGSSIALTVGSGAYISGAGGSGGAGTFGTGQTGGAGGTALRAQAAITITNNGTIQGGGGGGGGGGNGWGGGNGGAGRTAGAGGGNPGGYAPPEGGNGAAGTLTAGGVSGSYGGSGGAPGQAGGPASTLLPGAGGAGGACTSGNANITWAVAGTRLGTLG